MSSNSKNIDLIRKVFAAFARRDVEAVVEMSDPEIEFYAPTATLAHEGRSYRGHEGIRTYFQDVTRLWEELNVVPEEFREANGQLLVLGRIHARGAVGYNADSPAGWVWRTRGDKVVSGHVYTDPDEALKAVGLTK
jgi:ketosteroid isomerase-like protein